jgi:hypothetical protein
VFHIFISTTGDISELARRPDPNKAYIVCLPIFSNANANDTLFINKIAGILEKYRMHTPMELLINLPSKHMGKTMIKKAINEYWYKKFQKISLCNIYPVLLLLVLLPSMHRQL